MKDQPYQQRDVPSDAPDDDLPTGPEPRYLSESLLAELFEEARRAERALRERAQAVVASSRRRALELEELDADIQELYAAECMRLMVEHGAVGKAHDFLYERDVPQAQVQEVMERARQMLRHRTQRMEDDARSLAVARYEHLLTEFLRTKDLRGALAAQRAIDNVTGVASSAIVARQKESAVDQMGRKAITGAAGDLLIAVGRVEAARDTQPEPITVDVMPTNSTKKTK